MKRIIFGLLLTFNIFLVYGQNELLDYNEIASIALPFVQPLINGNVEVFERIDGNSKTWSYDDLKKYVAFIEEPDSFYISGRYIEKVNGLNMYGYNQFAYRKIGDSYEYLYAAIISVDVSSKPYKVENSFLFTTPNSLRDWWLHTFDVYNNSLLDDIPEEFKHPVCPPPQKKS